MKPFLKLFKSVCLFMALSWMGGLWAQANPNQTADISPIFSEDNLPFRIQIEREEFNLPNGIHSFVYAVYKGKWLLLEGRTNGMHSFNTEGPIENFPPRAQNRVVYVVDPIRKTVKSRALDDPGSGLTLAQVEILSGTSPQGYQNGKTLYIAGGYGVDTAAGTFTTKPVLTAIDIPGMISWVEHPLSFITAAHYIRQISDPVFQVTGGYMTQFGKNTLLVFGQNFEGLYFDFLHNSQIYTKQVRVFRIQDDGKKLAVKVLPSKPLSPGDGNYRRRDLNIVPVIKRGKHDRPIRELVALSGVFTEDVGIWTVPVTISANGDSSMPNPADPLTFKQGMNNYTSATVGLFSKKTGDMYNILLGGISYGFFEDNVFQTDIDFPFINQVTTVRINRHGRFKQFLMSAAYPFIPSYRPEPNEAMRFGAAAQFMPASNMPLYSNGVLKFDNIQKFYALTREPILIGHIVGGIQSAVANTEVPSDSAASPYIFKVYLTPTIRDSSSH